MIDERRERERGERREERGETREERRKHITEITEKTEERRERKRNTNKCKKYYSRLALSVSVLIRSTRPPGLLKAKENERKSCGKRMKNYRWKK